MNTIITKGEIAPGVYELKIASPVARRAEPGQFVIVMSDSRGERIPLTIADFDRSGGTVTLVVMVVGASSEKICALGEGQAMHALIGPLGEASELAQAQDICLVAGGVGTAPVYPIARAYFELGRRVTTIQGARSADAVFWQERLAAVSHRHILTTDDGSAGRAGRVTDALSDLIAESSKPFDRVVAIGPAPMMRAVAETTRAARIPTVVSLNSIMVDGTGMCGGCRVQVGDATKFTCVDGPEFDGHLVDWKQLMERQRVYHEQERCSLQRYAAEGPSRG